MSRPGMPCGKSSRLANHSAWDLPYSSISSHPSAPPITAHTAMTRISIRRCRLLGAWGQRGSVNVAKCSCNDEGTSIPMPSSPVVQKASGGKRFDHFNGKPSQFPNALTLPPTIPAHGPTVLYDAGVGAIGWRFDFNLALMAMPKRPKLSAPRAENLPQVSSGHTTPMTHGKRRVICLRSQTGEQGLRGIRKDHRVGLCETNIERFKQLPHRMKAVIIEQRSHPLPQQPLAAKLCPHGPKQGTTELLRLIHQKRQHHQHGKLHGEVLLAVTVVVLKVVALVL